jgi:hypothetical protein
MPLDDYDRLPIDRAAMIGHHLVAIDPDLPLILIGQKEGGKLWVSSTHGGPIVEKLLHQALKELVIYPDDEDDE